MDGKNSAAEKSVSAELRVLAPACRIDGSLNAEPGTYSNNERGRKIMKIIVKLVSEKKGENKILLNLRIK